ncbi:transmembrane protein 273 isoform X1 [Pyrgilauda ruficollis]|uniref:transmembrane protein 273 isoform X1 n=1 Tax=Pyrgilauda ruficollis TaxID=221976 RepID=UPI001B87B368|nr:transmembrane protein 273 isoform X1 [Pyrgilauda ruficollis]
MKTWAKPLCCHNFIMTLLTSWISAPTAFLLLHFWRAKVHASGNPEEEIDYTYVIIGVTLGAVLAIGFIAVIICMIKAKMNDSDFGGQTRDQAKTDDSNAIRNQSTRDQ